MTKYVPERAWPRLVPKGSVMVSVYGEEEQAYGVLSDVSLGGAQFLSGVLFDSGSRVLLRIGFNPDEPFSVPAEVIWCRDESDEQHRQTFVHGVKFRLEDPEQVARLKGVLESPGFVKPVLPGAPRQRGLDEVMTGLMDELDQLGEGFDPAKTRPSN